jgi:hypothetical protein
MRDTRKDEGYFKGYLEDIQSDIEKRLGKMDRIESMNPIASVNIPWALYEFYTEKMEIDYCLGVEISSFSENVNTALDWLQAMNDYGAKLQDRENQEYFADYKELTLDVLYKHIRWLTFALGSGVDRSLIKQAMGLMGQAGVDRYFDLLMVQLGDTGRMVSSKVRHPIIFKELVEIIEAKESERPKLIAGYLENWMSYRKKEGLKEYHTNEDFYYKGYWCYEAALVVMLWNIDDSSFRNNPYYPKDLVRKL